MHLPILIEPVAGNGYRAKSGEPLALSAEGSTRDEALQKLWGLVDERLHEGAQLASFEIPAAAGENPWLRMAGIYDPNDPIVQEWLEIMAENRREMDEDPDVP
jgi:hypothetical protein